MTDEEKRPICPVCRMAIEGNSNMIGHPFVSGPTRHMSCEPKKGA